MLRRLLSCGLIDNGWVEVVESVADEEDRRWVVREAGSQEAVRRRAEEGGYLAEAGHGAAGERGCLERENAELKGRLCTSTDSAVRRT